MNTDPEALAVFGGDPEFPAGPPSWPRQDEQIREVMFNAWKDGSWGGYFGPHGDRLVQRLCELHDVSHAMLCCSGTVAVELALRSVGVTGGDHVMLAAYDFPGNFRAVEAIGGWPVLFDLAPRRFVPTAQIIRQAITTHDCKVSAIIVSHLHGDLADMPGIMAVAKHYGIPVVEDASQLTGGLIEHRRVGSLGDVGVLSFGGSKLLTAGRGGALLSNHQSAMQRAKVFSERGNNAFPLGELQAAVLLPQLNRLDEDNATRATAVKQLANECSNLSGISFLDVPLDTWQTSYFKVGLTFDSTKSAWSSRADIVKAFAAEGIAIGEGFRGFARRSNRRCGKCGDLSNSVAAAKNVIVLHHPILLESNAVISRLAKALRKVANVENLPYLGSSRDDRGFA